MKNMLDSAMIDIPCPCCDKSTSESIGELKVKNQVTCRHCRQVFAVDATQMRTEISKVEQQLVKLGASLGRLVK